MSMWQAIAVGAAVVLVAGSTGAEAATPALASLTLAQPMPYEVVQRDGRNQGQLPIRGTYSGQVTRAEARYESMKTAGPVAAWTCVCSNPANGIIVGSLAAPAGGWYRVTVRVLDGDREVARQVVEKVGVGEVFITVGQSNAGNYGWPRQTPTEDRVAGNCAWCEAWRHGYDPQPWGGGSGGSPWPAMEDALVRSLDVPVAVIAVAAGGTSVSNWLPSSKQLYPGLKRALDFVGPHGARAILWHQGEAEAHLGTPADEIAQGMGEIIGQSRKDAGWDIPWGVALASFLPGNDKPVKGESRLANGVIVREGQKKACLIPGVFQGPLTDDMIGPEWRHDTVHMNAKGLREHGQRWATLVLQNLFPAVSTNAVRQASDAMAFVSPMPGYVAQRDAQNQGDVPVCGNFEGALTRVEGRWTPMSGGEPSPWILVADNPKDGYISGMLRVPVGWYKLTLCGLRDAKPVIERTIERVGVGEAFVVIGGESVANFGQSRQAAKDPRVFGYCAACYERPLNDPLRGAIGNQGSSWPTMGDALAAALDLPVEVVVCGYSGPMAQWKPGTSMYNGGILHSLLYNHRFQKGGCRAILWEVGEMDAKLGVKAEDYAAAFTSIVTQVHRDVGWEAPWVIAGVAYHPEAAETNRMAIREAQRKLCDGKTLLEGPTADDLTGLAWRYDGIHFTEAGLQEHGKRWARALQTLFFEKKRP